MHIRTHVRYRWRMNGAAISLLPQGFPPNADFHLTTAGALTDRAATPGVPVIDELAELFPAGRLRPGSSISIAGESGRTSLLLQLLAGATSAGHWCAVIGMPSLGIASAIELGVSLDRLALIPDPGKQWQPVTGALLSAVDLVVFSPSERCDRGQARRLLAQTRQHHSVFVVMEDSQDHSCWPEQTDLTLTAEATQWSGLSVGHGSLSSCQLLVNAQNRRAASLRRASCRIGRSSVTGTWAG